MFLSLSCAPRIVYSTGLECDPPPDAVQGREGIEIARDWLRSRQATGLLIGGLAKELWGRADPDDFEDHKDVDVIILTQGEDYVPEQFECGIDWWTINTRTTLPTNGYDIELLMSIKLDPRFTYLRPDLYLCPWETLHRLTIVEKRRLNEVEVFKPHRRPVPLLHLPALYESELVCVPHKRHRR